MDKNEKRNNKKFRDDSHFTRWINSMDEKDKSLSPVKRKGKWGLIVLGMFGLFGISFIWIPGIRVRSSTVESHVITTDSIQNPTLSTFEIPVDSFENRLKQKIHEELPEKE